MRRLSLWAESTAVCLRLLEARLRAEYPQADDVELRRRLLEHLTAVRHTTRGGP